MSRYIDAEQLWKYVENQKDKSVSANDFMRFPYIDIVRCKECRYCKRKRGTFKGEPIIFYRCEEHNRDVDNDDYCSWGERKSE